MVKVDRFSLAYILEDAREYTKLVLSRGVSSEIYK